MAVGGRILVQNREGDPDFVTIVHDVGLLFFGVEYLAAQEALPFEMRHVPIQWMHAWVEEHNRANIESPNDPGATQIGSGAAWLRFAFDIYTIQDNSELKASLRAKLLDSTSFQGARHELRVAAIWIAAGFTLTYENEKNVARTHPEFIATDPSSGLRVAVEAKSKHRTGVQGFKEGNSSNGRKALVRGLLESAYKKEVDLPLYAFLDLNLPRPESPEERDQWVSDIVDTIEDMDAEGLHAPSPVNVVFFTNDPSHYLLRDRLVEGTDNLWMLRHIFADPRIPHPDEDIVSRIERAHAQRVAPPDDYWEE